MATTKVNTNQVTDPLFNSSMARQAIINGNFDVWQRGTSLALADNTSSFLADRWRDYVSKDGGTLPTLTRTRQLLTTGDIFGATYFSRLTTDGAGTSLGNSSEGGYRQKIENGTSKLCGNGKTVTLSFWARSDIANKRIGVLAVQQYGTGGSPSSTEVINGTNFTLTSTWTKYTYTFTTNTLAGKTFGTGSNDYFEAVFYYVWGSTIQARVGASTAETFVGAGNIDIAQVQLCAGDVALPFMPKSFEEELRACQRYCYIAGNSETNYDSIANGMCISTTGGLVNIFYPAPMRITPTVTYPTANTLSIIKADGSTVACSSLSDNIISHFSARITFAVASGLTAGSVAILFSTSSPSKIIFSSEL